MPNGEINVRAYKTMFVEYPDIVGVKDIGGMLGIGRDKVYLLVRTGEIKKVPCSRSIKVPKAAVIEYVLRCIK